MSPGVVAGSPIEPGVPNVSPRALRLLAEVAHDIRSPLTSILFLVEGMHAGHAGPVTEQQERQLALIYTATFQLNMLVNDLTELANHGGDQRLRRERACFSLEDMLGSVRDLVQPVAEQRQLELRIEQTASDLRFGYPEALTRVLLNLVTNALRVTGSGFVAIEVRDHPKACVEFSVVDSGPGMSASSLSRLFQPFAGAGGQRRGISSAGLGLSICRRLVSAMGGELAVTSEVGIGSRFSFAIRLPRARTGCAPLGLTAAPPG